MNSPIKNINVGVQAAILVVDDHADVRFLVQASLLKFYPEIPVRVVSSGMMAAVELAKGGIKLVISDVRMSDGDGIWLHYFVQEYYEGMPIVFFTSSPEDVQKLASEPLRTVIGKNDIRGLMEKVGRLWNGEEKSEP